jgi:hypothetical protein
MKKESAKKKAERLRKKYGADVRIRVFRRNKKGQFSKRGKFFSVAVYESARQKQARRIAAFEEEDYEREIAAYEFEEPFTEVDFDKQLPSPSEEPQETWMIRATYTGRNLARKINYSPVFVELHIQGPRGATTEQAIEQASRAQSPEDLDDGWSASIVQWGSGKRTYEYTEKDYEAVAAALRGVYEITNRKGK